MKLKASNETEEVGIFEVIWEIFNLQSPYSIEDKFSEEINNRAIDDIKQALRNRFNPNVNPTQKYCEKDLNNFYKTVFNTIHYIINVDKESE